MGTEDFLFFLRYTKIFIKNLAQCSLNIQQHKTDYSLFTQTNQVVVWAAWFSLVRAKRETAKRDKQMPCPDRTDVNLIKTIIHNTHTHKIKHKLGGKNGKASANTVAVCVLVCCPCQRQTTTRERFLTIGCFIIQKDITSKQALEEQQGVNTDSRVGWNVPEGTTDWIGSKWKQQHGKHKISDWVRTERAAVVPWQRGSWRDVSDAAYSK